MTEPRSAANLFSEFAPVTAEAWKTRIEAELKGADFEKTLTRLTDEGIRIKPFYTAEDSKGTALPEIGSTGKGWRNCPQLLLSDVEEAKTQLKSLLPGADAVCLLVPARVAENLAVILAELPLNTLAVIIKTEQIPLAALQQLKTAAIDQGISLAQLKGSLEFDPLSTLTPSSSYNEAELAELFTFHTQLPGFQLLSVDGASFHNRGATATQELAFTLSAAVEYLHRLTDDGIDLAEALGTFTFRMAAGTNYFLELAKLRALRQLWKAVVLQFEGTGRQAAQLQIHSVTSDWSQALLDPHTNLLRATTEAMSAVLGGCDYLTVKPFDSVTRPGGTEFSQRIARNISIILKEESYLDRTSDAAAGSYYIEKLTEELTTQSWALFLELEQRGGYLRNVRSGYLNDQLEASRAVKQKAVATRKQVIVGTNQFASPSEKPAVSPAETFSQTTRAGSSFEQLRLTSAAGSGKGDTKGLVQIAVLGTSALRKARAAFASELLTLGGITSYKQEYATPEELPKHLLEKPNAAIILCAADEELPVWLPAVHMLMHHQSNAPEVFVAAPEAAVSQPELREHVTGFIYQGMNAISFLTGLQQTITGNQNF